MPSRPSPASNKHLLHPRSGSSLLLQDGRFWGTAEEAMETTTSSTAPAQGGHPFYNPDGSEMIDGSSMQPAAFASNLEKESSNAEELTCSSEGESYGDNADEMDVFEKETSSEGESALPVECILGLPEDLQQGEPSASKQGDVVSEIETEKEFEQFDVVQGCSGHYFAEDKRTKGRSKEKKITKLLNKLHIIKSSEQKHQEPTGPAPGWVRRIQQEWKSLQKDLPEGIFVRVYEERMELLRAAVVGPAGTPYHDGLFFFDVCFPSTYPDVPPLVYYHSRGMRLNPNLYASGRVCLSLLGTWYGRGCEKWNPMQSTLLQVLVSIQAIVFNPNPYFNEPYLFTRRTASTKKKSLSYNESVFLLSCKTMLYTLRQPPKHFEGLVVSHFRRRGRTILLACKAYMEGTTVGSEVLSGGQDRRSSADFIFSLKNHFNSLLEEFKAKGADCEGLMA